MSNAKIQTRLLEDKKDAAIRQACARAKALLMRLGTPGVLRDDDRLDATDEA